MILINGCSFTGLPNQWPTFFPLEHKNIAIPGSSNDNIFLSTIEELEKNDYDACIIMWTHITRTSMSTSNGEIIDILPNTPIPIVEGDDYLNPGEVSGELIETALKRFKKDFYSLFYSDEIQQRKLSAYQYAISNCCDKVLNLSVHDISGERDETHHPTSKTSQRFAEHLMDTYFNE